MCRHFSTLPHWLAKAIRSPLSSCRTDLAAPITLRCHRCIPLARDAFWNHSWLINCERVVLLQDLPSSNPANTNSTRWTDGLRLQYANVRFPPTRFCNFHTVGCLLASQFGLQGDSRIGWKDACGRTASVKVSCFLTTVIR